MYIGRQYFEILHCMYCRSISTFRDSALAVSSGQEISLADANAIYRRKWLILWSKLQAIWPLVATAWSTVSVNFMILTFFNLTASILRTIFSFWLTMNLIYVEYKQMLHTSIVTAHWDSHSQHTVWRHVGGTCSYHWVLYGLLCLPVVLNCRNICHYFVCILIYQIFFLTTILI